MNDPRNYSQSWMRSNFFPDFEITGGHWDGAAGYHLFQTGAQVAYHPVQDEVEGRGDSIMVYGYIPEGRIEGQAGAWVRQLVQVKHLRSLQELQPAGDDALSGAASWAEEIHNDTVPGAQRAYYEDEGQH